MKKTSGQEYFQLFFLLVCIIALVRGLSILVRGAEISAFIPVSISSVTCAWYFSRKKVRPIFLFFFLILGIMVLWFFTSGSITPLSKSIIYIGENQVDQILKITGYQNHIYPKHISIIQASINDIASLSMSMWLRSRVWMAGVGSGVNVSDQVVRIFAWCVILWIISGWAGWWVGRRGVSEVE